MPIEELFIANIEAQSLDIALRGDGLVILQAVLKGMVVPQHSTWQICNVRRKQLPQDSGIKCPAFFNPALKIRLVKAKSSQHLWDGVFASHRQCGFELPRERIPWTDRVQRALFLSPGAPMNAKVKGERALKLVARIETSQDMLLNRAVICFHLEDRVIPDTERYQIDLTGFFSMKVGEQMLQIGAIADAEYTMCIGGLSGRCVPDATSWSLGTQKSAEGGPDHLVLRVALTKSHECRGAWPAEFFTKWEPWQMSEYMKKVEDQEGGALADGATEEADIDRPDA